MKIEIKHRWTDAGLFALETESIRLCLKAAIEAKTDLSFSNLSDSNLSDSNLSEAKNAALPQARTVILPEGVLIGWKKCSNNVIVKLQIPGEAKRSNACGRKCRAEFADVLEVMGGTVGLSLIPSGGERLEYKAGERVKCVQAFDENRWNECSSGIHFYITREEAEASR